MFLKAIISVESTREILTEIYRSGATSAYLMSKKNVRSEERPKSLLKYQNGLERLKNAGILFTFTSDRGAINYVFNDSHPCVKPIKELIKLELNLIKSES